MKYQVMLRNEVTHVLEKETVIEADNDTAAELLATQLYPYAIIQLRKILLLTCYHINNDKTPCNYRWYYRGARTTSATCPNCHKQVYIQRAIVVSDE